MAKENQEWLQFMSDTLHDSAASTPGPSNQKPVAEKTLAPSGLPSSSLHNQEPALLTPPASAHGSPVEETEEPTIVSVSTTFYPGANLAPVPPDLIFISSDAVFFYVHIHQITDASTNKFNGLLPQDAEGSSGNSPVDADTDDVGPIVPLPEPSSVLNVILHAIYCMSSALYSPQAPTLLAAISSLDKYGVPLTKYAGPGTPLHLQILGMAPAAPVDFYACVAHFNLHELATQLSSHLLGISLADITDEQSRMMGPVYLKRLFFLHLGRVDALKRLLLPPPSGHSSTQQCDHMEQKKLTRAWALASAYLAWDARPDLSTHAMEYALKPLGEHLACEMCKTALSDRIKQLVIQWSLVKRTI